MQRQARWGKVKVKASPNQERSGVLQMTASGNLRRERPERPRGVWLLTIYALSFAGVLPAGLVLFVMVGGGVDSAAVYSLLIAVGVILTAIGAWQGQNRARLGLMVFVTLFYVGVGLNNLLALWLGSVPEAEQTRVLGRVLRGVLFPALYIWYFTRPATTAFYRVMARMKSVEGSRGDPGGTAEGLGR